MKLNNIIILLVAASIFIPACNETEHPSPSDDLGIMDLFSPPANSDARILEMYGKYDVWVNIDWDDPRAVYTSPLATDPIYGRYDALHVADEYRESAIMYAQAVLSNVSEEFSHTFFPHEWWLVGSYGGSFWMLQYKLLGRDRFILVWPNETVGTLEEINSPQDHYYQDSLLASIIWTNFGQASVGRMREPISEFVLAGKAYDNGEAIDKIYEQYYEDYDVVKRDAAIEELMASGGFVTGSGSRTFSNDFSSWMTLLAMESYDNIRTKYLDNSPARAAKYEAIISFFASYGWDIQSAGNKYRLKYDEYLASQP